MAKTIRIVSFFPKSYSLDNYIKLFTDTGILNFPRMFTNTLIVAVFSCIISTFFVLSVAYCMSRLKFKMRKAMMNVAMILGLFPAFMAMIAVYYILKAIGLSEGSMIRVALVLVYSASAGIQFYIAKGFFDTIPKTIDEAALIDGATKWQVFTKITIPLSKPIIVYTVLTSFIAPWVDFIFARVICRANADYYMHQCQTVLHRMETSFSSVCHPMFHIEIVFPTELLPKVLLLPWKD